MKISRLFFIWTILLFLFLLLPSFAKAQPIRDANTEVELFSEVNSVKPGESFWIAVHMKMDDDWHVYWRNPGDSGIPPTIKWDLPDGFHAGEILWPTPKKIDLPPLRNYGYEGAVTLLVEIDVSSDVPFSEVALKARFDWLACKIQCVPGTANFHLNLPVSNTETRKNLTVQSIFSHARDQLPLDYDTTLEVTALDEGGYYLISLIWTEGRKVHPIDGIYIYPLRSDLIDHAADQRLEKVDRGYRLTMKRTDLVQNEDIKEILAVIVFNEDSGRMISLHKNIPIVGGLNVVESSPANNIDRLGLALFFAFLGGIILNLMPCVLPVLSIKIMGLVTQDKNKIVKHALVFSLGIVVTFWFLAGFILVLQFAGKQVGWGFQFQEPVFLVFMAILFFWLGLNLLGVFEVGVSVSQVGASLNHSLILRNPFFNGMLATIVATPCTAPFMGSAMGFALTKQPFYSFMIFTALGVGMAFPYLAISTIPFLRKFIPKPGRWMLVLKRCFSLLFFVTVVWLAWVLRIQKGVYAMSSLYVGLVIIAISAGIIGKWAVPNISQSIRWRARIVGIFLFCSGCGVALVGAQKKSINIIEEKIVQDRGIKWMAYSPQLMEDLRTEGKPVFLDFTASWCISCQVNERLALTNKTVIKKFDDLGIVLVKADWTNYNEEVTQALQRFGKNSIPFYVLYTQNQEVPYIYFPEILTSGIILDVLSPNEEFLK